MKKKLIRITTVPVSLKVLLKGQLNFMAQYYDIVAVSSGDSDFDEALKQENVRGVAINMSRKITPIKDLLALVKLIALFYKEKPFIVHTHTPKAGTLGMLAAYVCRVPHRLHTVAGLPLLEATGKKRKLLDFVEKITYRCATRIYPNSVEMKKIILHNSYTSASKLRVIGNGSSNGIDTQYFSTGQVKELVGILKSELEINKDDFVFCFVGRIVRDKGIEELIGAFQRLSEFYSQIKLILVGNYEKQLDPLTPMIEQTIEHHPMIRFVGFQNDVRPYLVLSDAFVFPSYREGFPNVVMQAGAMGIPSIVSDINGCNEIIQQGVNGHIIPVKDKDALYNSMEYFICNKDKVIEMAQHSREIITQRYEREYVWNCILEEYKSLENK